MAYTRQEKEAYRQRIHLYERGPTWAARSRRYRAKMRRAKRDRCAACGKPRIEDVHHVRYGPPGRAFTGQEPDRDLVGLCHADHMRIHDLTRPPYGLSLVAATARVVHRGRRVYSTGRAVAVALFVIVLVVWAVLLVLM